MCGCRGSRAPVTLPQAPQFIARPQVVNGRVSNIADASATPPPPAMSAADESSAQASAYAANPYDLSPAALGKVKITTFTF